MKKLLIPIALAVGLAACGGSSKAPGVELAPSGGPTAASVTATTTTTASSSTSSVGTPKPPSPLSKEPTVTVPKTPPPKVLVTKDEIKGTGAVAKAGSTVTVNYVGVLYSNGKVFDASWNRHEPFSFTLGEGKVIPGWDQGVVGMKVGGRRELIIPAPLAYGAQGSPPTIPPNSALVFVVDLLST
jgi:peptidylprolyl isomerase